MRWLRVRVDIDVESMRCGDARVHVSEHIVDAVVLC